MLALTGLGTVAVLCPARADCTAGFRLVAVTHLLNRRITHPEPDTLTCCGLPALSSLIEISALRDPTAAGLKVTVMTQELPIPTLGIQVCVGEKSPGLVPVELMPVMFSVVPPALVSIVVCGRLIAPTRTV
jgi:hypothetical protein